ncbi:hypothetical protein [Nocardia sp. NPDC052316]|uniref:hypothetical protein n=1 Tax=Nocardia sp. NPDC052316 TaxID=3364329 RepID=UPI0037C98C70
MTVAAFVVSLVALAVAIASAGFTWRNVRVNLDRRRDELKPQWGRREIATRDPTFRIYELVLVLEVGDLDSITVEFAQDWPAFVPGALGVISSKCAEFGSMTDGDEAWWQVDVGPLGEHPASSFRLKLTSRSGKHTWTQTFSIPEPHRLIPLPPAEGE